MFQLTLQSFAALTFADRLQLINADGVYLGVYRHTDAFFVALYSLHGFYVEVWYSPESDEIAQLTAFDDWEKLDPFLVDIDISEACTL